VIQRACSASQEHMASAIVLRLARRAAGDIGHTFLRVPSHQPVWTGPSKRQLTAMP